MTKIVLSAQPPAEKVHELVVEVIQAATIALVAVLGIVTVATTI
jgi:hypothetical protein